MKNTRLHLACAGASLAVLFAAATGACGDDEEDATGTPGSTAVTTSAASTSGSTGGASTTASTAATGGAGGTSGTGGTGGAGQGGAGGSLPLVNGCNVNTATDMTQMANVTLPEWSFPHASCIIVDAGTVVTWNTANNENFGFHPLVGGVTPTVDTASPITTPTATGTTHSVTLPTAGDFPYFCTSHGSSMQGVIYVL